MRIFRNRAASLRLVPVLTAVLLLLTASTPIMDSGPTTIASILAGMGVIGTSWLAVLWWRRTDKPARVDVKSAARPTLELVLHLSPVALLTLVFPIASHRIGSAQVGGADLTSLLLASSLTVPWLSQAVCLPMYRAIGSLIAERDMPVIQRRFFDVWPATFVQTVPIIVVFAVPVELAMRWSVKAAAVYVTLCLLHMAFAQSLIIANVGRRRVLWAVAWAAYAAALFVVPTLWFLPPLVGLLTQLVAQRAFLPRLRVGARLEHVDVLKDMLRGLLLGSVLWADKFFYFLKSADHFAVTEVFLAMLPAVLAYNYYFVRLAPTFDDSVGALRVAMEREPYSTLASRSRQLASTVQTSVNRTALVGALLAFALTDIVAASTPADVRLIAAVAVASWLFMMTTVLSYKLDYAGKTGIAQLYGLAHLVLCAAVFLWLPAGAMLYAALAVGELGLMAVVWRSTLFHWRASEYTLFWRHATAW